MGVMLSHEPHAPVRTENTVIFFRAALGADGMSLFRSLLGQVQVHRQMPNDPAPKS